MYRPNRLNFCLEEPARLSDGVYPQHVYRRTPVVEEISPPNPNE
jgi:hypothetical protein